ncbi:hypothetical protein ACYEXS_35710 [Paenibacillus sp. MAH-36]|uniref:Uncharacterized protein n=1 Tax=Paenibacillus violae TaxID=3077234 RepID=A0ABU3RIA9_9BACL|nr:hypothetical protein [Paenibacillus sp. PFR10]MDU0203977.1 hypothetical protein [Paenibacillus sp. PFR10]
MKRTAFIHIRDSSDTLQKIHSLFEDRLDEISFQPSGLQIKTDEDRSGYQDLISLIKNENLSHTYAENREYTKQEMKEAAFFDVGVYYPWEHDALKDAEHYGTKYKFANDHCCEYCGKIQASELKLDVKKIRTKHFVQIKPELIITDYAKEVIESNQLTGCDILPASDYKNRNVQKVYQLVVKNVLPPLDDQVRFESYGHHPIICCECRFKGIIRSEMIYRKEEMEKFRDFNLTFEYLNVYETRLLIVSAKVKELFQKHKIKLYRPEPVRFI